MGKYVICGGNQNTEIHVQLRFLELEPHVDNKFFLGTPKCIFDVCNSHVLVFVFTLDVGRDKD